MVISRRFAAAISNAVDDCRVALRLLRRNLTYATAVIGTLAVAIGANSAIFAVINAIWFRPLQVQDPATVGILLTERPGGTTDQFRADALQNLSLPAFFGFAAELTAREITSDFQPRVAIGEHAVVVSAVSDRYFSVLGVPVRGQDFTHTERYGAAAPPVILSDAFWSAHFNSDRTILGQTVALGSRTVTIVGIAPRHFRGALIGSETELWIPLAALSQFAPVSSGAEQIAPVRIYARMQRGTSVQEASAQLSNLFGKRVSVQTLDDDAYPHHLAAGFGLDKRFVLLLAATVAVVLLVGCVNLAGLFIARSESRRAEIAARMALGIPRGRLFQFLSCEIVLLAIAGGAASLLTAQWFLAALSSAALPSGLTVGHLEPRFDWRVCLATAITTFVVSAITGLIPVVSALRADAAGLLTARLTRLQHRPMISRYVLLAAHAALSVALLTTALSFVRTVVGAFRADYGFAVDRTMSILLQPRLLQYAASDGKLDTRRRAAEIDSFVGRLSSLAGVAGVELGSSPLQQVRDRSVRLSVTSDGTTRDISAQIWPVGARYFQVSGMSVVNGREFTSSDTVNDGSPVVILNEACSRMLWPGESALGKRVAVAGQREAEVVGVVSNAVRFGIRGSAQAVIYRPTRSDRLQGQFVFPIIVRTHTAPAAAVATIRQELHRAFPDPSQAVISTTREEIARQTAGERLAAGLFSWFGIAALLLCALGMYGVVTYIAASRMREFAIRFALGAQRRDVVWQIARGSMGPLVAGTAVGIGLVLAAHPVVRARLYDIGVLQASVLSVSAVILVLSGGVAALLGMRGLLALDTAQALRHE